MEQFVGRWRTRVSIIWQYGLPVVVLPLVVVNGIDFVLNLLISISVLIQMGVVLVMAANVVGFVAAFYLTIIEKHMWLFTSRCSTMIPTIKWGRQFATWLSTEDLTDED